MKNAECFAEVRVSIITFQWVCLSSLISQHRVLYTGEVNASSFWLSMMHLNPPVAPTDPVISLAVKDGTAKHKQEVWRGIILSPVENQAIKVFCNSPKKREKNPKKPNKKPNQKKVTVQLKKIIIIAMGNTIHLNNFYYV